MKRIVVALITIATALGATFVGSPQASATQNDHAGSIQIPIATGIDPSNPHNDQITPKEEAGQYYYMCTNMGQQYPWNHPADPNKCPGWLDVYIGGKNVAHVNTGMAGKPDVTASCVAGLAFTVISLVVPGGVFVDGGRIAVGMTLGSLGITLLGCSGY
ncbi:hypothetical protein [Arcanobacterium bovis]|uniref:Uncharacterized protein n=1 Tax=Arcanobacterium bovis TaxID=2529275 RepID=A0A4Q9UZH4_9ACTO|nr:hypothetical protein [Arcanobacterium bovis]TBW21081.1 hypothetical protein EZJ44_07190 [Arcanobacterium bovis]